MPAKSVDSVSSLCYRVIPVIGHLANLPGWSLQAGHRQVWFPQRRPSDSQCIDGIGSAIPTRAVAGMGHHLRRHSHDPLASAGQVSFRAPERM